MNNLQSLKVEVENIITGQLLDNRHIVNILDNLTENDFDNNLCRNIYIAVSTLEDNKNEISLPSVYAEVKKLDKNVSMSHLNNVVSNFFCLNDIYYYIIRLKDLNNRIEAINILKEGIRKVEDLKQDTDEMKVDISTQIDNSIKAESKHITIEEATNDFIDMIEYYMTNKNTDLQYQIPTLDKLTGGMGNAQLITVGAKSGHGKTSFVVNIATTVAKTKKVLFISREMNKSDLVAKFVSRYSAVSMSKIKSGVTPEELQKVIQTTGKINKEYKRLIIDDTSKTVRDIKLSIKKYKPDLVIIDYVQLVIPTDTRETRERQVASISRSIKQMTLDFNMPIIQLTQLNDDMGDFRPRGERPMRESKAIYHDSNVVIYLHEPKLEEEVKKAKAECRISDQAYNQFYDAKYRLIEVILDKQREGVAGEVIRTWFNGLCSTYGELPSYKK